MSNNVCPTCGSPLTKIDRYGEELIGCIDCNRWGHPGDKKFMMAMQEDDLEALRASVRRRHPPH
jgi:Zn-finger nucleic acid-binding protein